MALLEMRLQLADQLLLDVQDTPAHLANRVVVISAGQLVVRRALAQVGGIHRSRRGQRIEGPVHGAPRKPRLAPVQLRRYLVGRAVAAEPDDGVINLRSLRGPAHPRSKHQETAITRKERSAFVSSRHPARSTTTSSSIRTPPHPGM